MRTGDTAKERDCDRAARHERLLARERKSDRQYGRPNSMPSGWWILPAVLAGLGVWIGLIGRAVGALLARAEDSLVGDAIGVAAIAVIFAGAIYIGRALQ